ncbi:hypothetical protein MKW94_010035 [Papaver nudicaule]|uniref:Ribosomal RNA methyltransferase FtsJ domain-containing protein n=1 Tax=Papaver nudicaule TaxID=74823 RepID=A0AA41SGG6_PAPNU|nr:hypothetical protein [Papaver nudicaule]
MAENGVTGFDIVMRGALSPSHNATTWDQASLLTESIKLATEFLALDGTFITKMFDGAEDYTPMLYCLEQLCCKVVVTKPSSTSAETYIVALNYKAPEKINPRLLVARNLFSINEDIPTVKTKRIYSGGASTSYSDEESVAGRAVLASDFVWSETPLEVLGIAYSLSFDDDACLSLKNHNLTTKMVKMICKDLRVMDKQRFKCLMKWRLDVREALSYAQKAIAADAKDENKGNNDEMPTELEFSLKRYFDKQKRKMKRRN